jgi:hypothetical protein
MARALALALAGLALALAAGCTPTVSGEARPALADLRQPLHRIALVPLAVAPALAADPESDATPPDVAAQLVSRFLAEALAARGVEVIPPEDVAATLASGDATQPIAARLAAKHGIDALLAGELTRWEEREGEALGTLHAAAVGFRVTLRGAPGGQRLWDADFDERQQPLGDNVLRAGRYPGGGTRWLTAEELARWGAEEIVRALPLERPR